MDKYLYSKIAVYLNLSDLDKFNEVHQANDHMYYLYLLQERYSFILNESGPQDYKNIYETLLIYDKLITTDIPIRLMEIGVETKYQDVYIFIITILKLYNDKLHIILELFGWYTIRNDRMPA